MEFRMQNTKPIKMVSNKNGDTKLYIIEYYVNGNLKETIGLNSPMKWTIAKWKIKQLEQTTHKLGKLIPKRVRK